MTISLRYPLILAVVALAAAPLAAGAADGKALHEQNCISCHKSMMGGDPNSIYTRKDHKVTSLDGLKKQVRRCELSLGLKWFDDQVDAVADYLNKTYYHFN